jgi:hypothetical protein
MKNDTSSSITSLAWSAISMQPAQQLSKAKTLKNHDSCGDAFQTLLSYHN